MSPAADRPLHIGVAGPCSPKLFAADLNQSPQTLPEGLGGTPVNHLVRAWLDAGHEVTIATLDSGVSSKEIAVFRGERLTVAVGCYRPRGRARDAFLRERRAIAAGLLSQRPDVVSAHWSYEFALGAIATGLPTLVTVHDVPREVFKLQPSIYRGIRWLMHRAAIRGATRVAFNSPYTRANIAPRALNSAVVLPNAIPDDQFVLLDRDAPDSSAPRFVSVNNGFTRLKNVGSLLQAFVIVRRKARGARLRLVGRGFDNGGPACEWARRRGLDEGVVFLGPLSYQETLAEIRAADVLVHPSLEESFGYTLIEAASVGTPVIGGRDSGAVPWVLAQGRAGRLVDVTNPVQIANAMLTLVRNVSEWAELRHQAFRITSERFSVPKVAAAYVDVLQEMVP